MQLTEDNQLYKFLKKLMNSKAGLEILQEKWKQQYHNYQCAKQI